MRNPDFMRAYFEKDSNCARRKKIYLLIKQKVQSDMKCA